MNLINITLLQKFHYKNTIFISNIYVIEVQASQILLKFLLNYTIISKSTRKKATAPPTTVVSSNFIK